MFRVLSSRPVLALLGVVFHIVFLYSAIDIYFRSPLVHGVEPIPSPIASTIEAKRIVFIVGDGLRADKLFSHHSNGMRPLFLRRMLETQGRWGISHTRVPTESRPCHVAMFAGFYEDVSAITKGWQANVVEFDSVFNRSARAWGFGSPDVVPMFAVDVPHMEADCYPPELEDFGEDARQTDRWVDERIRAFFDSAAHNATLDRLLRQDGVVFFFHLLGLDTAGHVHKPHSQAYREHIDYVDSLVEGFVHLFHSFYGEAPDRDRTVWMFTGDHGMSNHGAHGDGDPDCTRTPFITWGPGIHRPSPPAPGLTDHRDAVLTHGFPTPDEFNLTHLRRLDIHQADISVLMSAVLGRPIPVNSVGVLPTEYLAFPPKERSLLFDANARALARQFQKKSLTKGQATGRLFRPYARAQALEASLEASREALARGDYAESDRLSRVAIRLAQEGLAFFQTYDRTVLYPVVVSAFVGWVLVLLSRAASDQHVPRRGVALLAFVFLGGAGALMTYLALTSAPAMHYVYLAFPLVFFLDLAHTCLPARTASERRLPARGRVLRVVLSSGAVAAVVAMLVAGYFHREIFAVFYTALAALPVVIFASRASTPWQFMLGWPVASLVVACCHLLPADLGDQAVLWWTGATVCAVLLCRVLCSKSRRAPQRYIELAFILLSIALVAHTNRCFARKEGLPRLNQYAAWALFLGSFLLPFLPRSLRPRNATETDRLISIAASFGCPMILLSVNFEALFFAALTVLLLHWRDLELRLTPKHVSDKPSPLRLRDAWTAMWFLVLVHTAFFGTGNVASITSFQLASTYRFVTVFSPYLMTALLIAKILLPFLLVATVYASIACARTGSSFRAVPVVLALCDLMALSFFFLVRDVGSWQEIGMSISHYVITNAFSLFVVVLLGATRLYLPADPPSSSIPRSASG